MQCQHTNSTTLAMLWLPPPHSFSGIWGEELLTTHCGLLNIQSGNSKELKFDIEIDKQ